MPAWYLIDAEHGESHHRSLDTAKRAVRRYRRPLPCQVFRGMAPEPHVTCDTQGRWSDARVLSPPTRS